MAKRQTTARQDVIDIGQPIEQAEDEQLATSAGVAVASFVAGVRSFFLTARTLETKALATLEDARKWKANPPKTEAADLELQTFIRRTSAENKAVAEHWKITTVISGFHRRMTAKRGIATTALEDANKIGNELHNAYVREEQRRVAEENARIQREAEQAAEAARQLELAELEAEAVRREEAAAGLSERETAFVELFSIRGEAVGAARMAGFKDAAKASVRLLGLAKIQAALEAKKSAAAIRRQAEAVARQPVMPVAVEEVRANITKATGSQSRTRGSAELLDEAALIDAVFSGKYGIPRSILRVDPVALNKEAADLGDRINRWPGCRFKEDTRLY